MFHFFFFEHVTKELTALAPSTIKIKEELPDGNIIIDGVERFRCVKVFFQPSSFGEEASGFHDTSFPNIMKCDVDIRKVVRQCLVVTCHDHFPRDS